MKSPLNGKQVVEKEKVKPISQGKNEPEKKTLRLFISKSFIFGK